MAAAMAADADRCVASASARHSARTDSTDSGCHLRTHELRRDVRALRAAFVQSVETVSQGCLDAARQMQREASGGGSEAAGDQPH